MAKTSPTQRSLKHFRELGYAVQVVERWNPFARRRVDLFGFIDLIAIGPGEIIGVQSTSGDNVAARLAKIKAEPLAQTWLLAGGRIVIQGWRKLKKSRSYTAKQVEVTLAGFDNPSPAATVEE